MMGEREERERGRGVECWMGDGVASRRWWERPTRKTNGWNCNVINKSGDVFLCVPLRDRSLGTHPWMMKGNHVFGKQT